MRNKISARIIVCVFVTAISISCSDYAHSGEQRKTDTFAFLNGTDDYSVNHAEKIDPDKKLLLAENGEARGEIVVFEQNNKATMYAAKELQNFLKLATGAEFPILKNCSGNGVSLVLGDSEWTRVWEIDIKNMPRDAYIIRNGNGTPDNVIMIAGRDDPYADTEKGLTTGVWAQYHEHATLFGVYDFLERFVGVRFYFPGEMGTVVPKNATLSIPSMDIYETPDFSVRNYSVYGDPQWPYEGGDKLETLRTWQNQMQMRMRNQTRYIPNCHGLSRLAMIERFAETHPEYFSLRADRQSRDNDPGVSHAGHLCYSNPELQDEISRDAEAYLRGFDAASRGVRHSRYGNKAIWDQSGAQAGFFNIMPQDGLGESKWCHCEKCWPYWENGKQGELLWRWTVEVANRMKARGVPGYVTNMAYGVMRPVPEVDIPDNVLVMVALPGPWREPDAELQRADDELIRAWNKKVAPNKVWLWNYTCHYANGVPEGVAPLAMRAVSSYYKRNAPHLIGAYMESEIDYFLFNYLNLYTFSKTCWNSTFDVEKMLAEHNELMFGPAAGAMGNFFDKIEETWMAKGRPVTKDTPMGPTPVKIPPRVMWEEIYTSEYIAECDALFDRAEKEAAEDEMALKRVKFFREKFLGQMKFGSNNYLGKKRKVEDLALQAVAAKGEIVVDGNLDEAVWNETAAVSMTPLNSTEDPLVKTAVRAVWIKDNLYLSFDCEEPLVERLSLVERENDDKQIWNDSSVEIFLNPSGDRKNYYQIIINANGVVADQKVSTSPDNIKNMDWEWNVGAEVKAVKHEKGYRIEARIPVAGMAPDGLVTDAKWIANFCRNRCVRDLPKEENQLLTWSPYLQVGFHDLDNFGKIVFVAEKKKEISLLENGSFELLKKDGSAENFYWPRLAPDSEARCFIDEKTYRDGFRSLRLENPGVGSIKVRQNLPGLKPDTEYLLTFFARTENVNLLPDPKYANFGGGFLTVWASRKFNKFMPQEYLRGTRAWDKFGVTFRTPPETGTEGDCYMYIGLANTNGTVWFDDVRLREVESLAKL
jgi:hypothetical protein